MITAKNYAEQAVPGLTKDLKASRKNAPHWADDHEYVEHVIGKIKESVHFIVPDGGRIFDDNFKGLNGQEIRLPFPSITLSYYVPDTEKSTANSTGIKREAGIEYAQGNVRKRLVIAQELDIDLLPKHSHAYKSLYGVTEKVIVIDAAYYFDDRWVTDNGHIVIPCSWENAKEKAAGQYLEDLRTKKNDDVSFVIYPVPRRKSLMQYGATVTNTSYQKVYQDFVKNMDGEMGTLLEFCEALTCSNVGFEKVERSKVRGLLGAKKKGRPSFETYTLTIDTPSTRKVYDDADKPEGRTHKSPRQHLRRGHIRMLADGRRIWVNSCVVGSIANGKIEKDYEVKHDSL